MPAQKRPPHRHEHFQQPKIISPPPEVSRQKVSGTIIGSTLKSDHFEIWKNDIIPCKYSGILKPIRDKISTWGREIKERFLAPYIPQTVESISGLDKCI